MKHQVLTIVKLITISVALALASCGGAKGKSASIGVAIIPERPIVITGDGTGFNGRKVAAPWFGFSLKMSNPTEEPITIIGIQVEVSSVGSSGELTTSTFTWTPAEWNFGYSDLITCSYYSFGTFNAGAADQLMTLGVTGVNECSVVPVFVPNGIPSGPTKDNFSYTVKLKPLGWFGTFIEPSDRLEKFKFFTTQ